MTDWPAIRSQFEQGISQRSLATKYGISQSAISQKAKRDGWLITPLIIPTGMISSDKFPDDELSEMEIVQKALNQLAAFLNDGLVDLRDHKLFADALSQYIKLKITIPQEQESAALDMRDFLAWCTDAELDIVRPIIHAAQLRKQEADEKIKPIRKVG